MGRGDRKPIPFLEWPLADPWTLDSSWRFTLLFYLACLLEVVWVYPYYRLMAAICARKGHKWGKSGTSYNYDGPTIHWAECKRCGFTDSD